MFVFITTEGDTAFHVPKINIPINFHGHGERRTSVGGFGKSAGLIEAENHVAADISPRTF